VLLQTKHGRKVLEPRFDLDFDTKRDSSKNCLAGVQSTPESEASISSEEELGDAREGDEESSDDDQGEERYKEKKDDEGDIVECGDDFSLDIKMKECLNRLDLSYVHEGIRPHLDTFHKKRLDGVFGFLAWRITGNIFCRLPSKIIPGFCRTSSKI
jgi:hypothetical protein